jgi:hypothetical protein
MIRLASEVESPQFPTRELGHLTSTTRGFRLGGELNAAPLSFNATSLRARGETERRNLVHERVGVDAPNRSAHRSYARGTFAPTAVIRDRFEARPPGTWPADRLTAACKKAACSMV